MPNFQGSVNQVLGTIGALDAISGAAAERREIKRLGKEEKVTGKQLQNLVGDVEESVFSGDNSRVKEQGRELSRLAESSLAIRERQYQLNPTQKNYDAVMDARTAQRSIKEMFSLEERQELAMDRMGERAEAKKTQRRNFMDYLSKQPTSLGGTVGELPKPLQKQVASQYTKSQRKTMMDRMDREANDGKQE